MGNTQSKEEERAALKKIQKIIDGLDPFGYVASAMIGVIELAEDNIRDDFCLDFPGRIRHAEQRAELAETEATDAKNALNVVKKERDTAERRLQETAETYQRTWTDLEEARRAAEEAERGRLAALADKAELEAELIRLKAKLYDLIVA